MLPLDSDHKRLFGFYFIAGLVLFHCGCQGQPKAKLIRYRQTRLHLGTIVHLNVCATPNDRQRMDQAFSRTWAMFDHIYARMSPWDPESDVFRINHTYPQPVQVDCVTYKVIEAAVHYSALTNGAFDITVLPLDSLWSDHQTKRIIPDHQLLLEKKQYVGSHYLKLIPPDRVQRLSPNTRVDLGGIAKGYAIDEAARIFREEGFHDFYIEAGGDVYGGGVNCQGRPWQIGIRHPRQPRKIFDVLALNDMAATTSGDYVRFFVVDEQRWSHIINPITGYPQRGVASATVVAPRAMTADALSTALCILTHRMGLPIIEAMGPGYAALILEEDADGRLRSYPSERYVKYR